jgi:flagellar FliJ protein
MKREQRITTYKRTLETGEREAATRLHDADGKLVEAKQRLAQLEQYKSDYTLSFGERAAQGISGPALLDFQAFIARLGDAIQQQAMLVTRMELERQQAHQGLRDAAVRNRAVGAVVERWRAEDRTSENRREQRDTDERAQQSIRIAAVNA